MKNLKYMGALNMNKQVRCDECNQWVDSETLNWWVDDDGWAYRICDECYAFVTLLTDDE